MRFEMLQAVIVLLVASGCSSQSAGGGSQIYGPWSCNNCSMPQYNDQSLSGQARWDVAQASWAWRAIMDNWSNYRNTPNALNFTNYVATSLGDGENIQCSMLGPGSNCMGDNVCIVNPGFDSIYRSFAWLNNFHYTLFQGTQTGISSNVALLLPAFSSQFALQLVSVKQGFSGNLAWIDLIALGAAIMSAVTFNVLLPALGIADAALLGMAKDAVTPLLVQTANVVKDTMRKAAAGNVFNSEAELSDVVAVIASAWVNGTSNQLQNLFNGSDPSNTQLYNLISDGKLFSTPYTDQNQVEQLAERVTFGYLVPAAWQLSNQNLVPIVLDAGAPCPGPTFFDDLIESRVCVNGFAYFLLNCATTTYPAEGLGTVYTVELQKLPGIDELQSGTYTITTQDIVAGVINSYNNNNHQNNWSQIDVSNSDVMFSLLTTSGAGVQSPGFFSFPIYNSGNVGSCNS